MKPLLVLDPSRIKHIVHKQVKFPLTLLSRRISTQGIITLHTMDEIIKMMIDDRQQSLKGMINAFNDSFKL
jgi:hypothetical protein